MGTNSLEKWYSQSRAGMLDTLRTQDRYLDLNSTQLLEYTRSRSEGLQDIILSEETVAEAIKTPYYTWTNDCYEEENIDGVNKEINMLYELLVLPFAQWLIDTDYSPKKKFIIERMKDYEQK